MSAVNLQQIKDDFLSRYNKINKKIIVCGGTGCVSSGSLKIYDTFKEKIKALGYNVEVILDKEESADKTIVVKRSGCQGFCQQGPLVTILPDNLLYCKVKLEDIDEIIEKTVLKNEPIERLLYLNPRDGKRYHNKEDIPYYSKQKFITLALCGSIDSGSIEEYIANDGYFGAEKAYKTMTDKEICDEVLASGLRGRGGAGFPTGRKWDFARIEPEGKKYIICNGDEGDPGAFMDCSVMEGNPHSVIEGMMIAAKAFGADEGYVYVRTEYPRAVERMGKAIRDAEALGILGENIFGTGYNFKLQIMEGAGAFVCGEETALIHSVEGERGMPIPKPPFPAHEGLFKKPTCINNVETLSIVPNIIRNGAAEYKKIGTETSAGTKTFSITGNIVNTGLVEVPMGATLRDLIFEIGGGVTDNAGNPTDDMFKSVQIGGPSGGCLTPEHLDIPIDYDSLKAVGAIVGSGGLVVMNKNTCMIQIAKFFMTFTQSESCGKCTMCREGTKQMLQMLTDITEGKGTPEMLDLLEKTAKAVSKGSLCALGKTAPNPVLSTLRFFRDEYEAHIIDKKCPTKQCKALCAPVIDKEKCKGCGLCAKQCPVGAISGNVKDKYVIDDEKCIKCGACVSTCKFGAIEG